MTAVWQAVHLWTGQFTMVKVLEALYMHLRSDKMQGKPGTLCACPTEA